MAWCNWEEAVPEITHPKPLMVLKVITNVTCALLGTHLSALLHSAPLEASGYAQEQPHVEHITIVQSGGDQGMSHL